MRSDMYVVSLPLSTFLFSLLSRVYCHNACSRMVITDVSGMFESALPRGNALVTNCFSIRLRFYGGCENITSNKKKVRYHAQRFLYISSIYSDIGGSHFAGRDVGMNGLVDCERFSLVIVLRPLQKVTSFLVFAFAK